MAKPQTDSKGQIQKRNGSGDQPKSLAALVRDMTPEIKRALPRHLNPDRMARIVTTALRTVPQLTDSTPASFLGCVIQCAQLGLEPCTPLGHAYLIPFRNRKQGTTECTLIVGYKGMIELARRSGMVSNVYAYAVREGDDFRFQLGTKRMIHHVPSEDPDREERPITHVYAVAVTKQGEPEFQVLTRPQIEKRRNRSRAKDAGPWVTDYEAMCLKTAVRALAPWIPQSPEFARAVALEEADEAGNQVSALDDGVKTALLASGVASQDDLAAEPVEGEFDEPSDPAAGPDGAPEPGASDA